MINTYLSRKKQQGVVTFIITSILIILVTLITLFAAGYNAMQQKTAANQYRTAQAYAAAEAGLDVGVAYLQINYSSILATQSSGFLTTFTNSNVTNVSLTNGSVFSIVYSNPVMNNFNLIKITATGTSNDGTATRSISQQVYFGSLLTRSPSAPLVSKGSVAFSGSSTITNQFGSTTVQSASSVTFSGSSQSVTASGVSSTASNTGADVLQNNTSLQSTSTNDFFATYFGATSSIIKNNVTNYYSNTGNTDYSNTLNGMTGSSVWIDQVGGTATINGNTTIGTATNPVLLIINGNLSMSGNVTVHGLIYVTGTSGITPILGNVTIDGGLITSDSLTISGSTSITYNPTLLTNLRNLPTTNYYAKIPGSWKDF